MQCGAGFQTEVVGSARAGSVELWQFSQNTEVVTPTDCELQNMPFLEEKFLRLAAQSKLWPRLLERHTEILKVFFLCRLLVEFWRRIW